MRSVVRDRFFFLRLSLYSSIYLYALLYNILSCFLGATLKKRARALIMFTHFCSCCGPFDHNMYTLPGVRSPAQQ